MSGGFVPQKSQKQLEQEQADDRKLRAEVAATHAPALRVFNQKQVKPDQRIQYANGALTPKSERAIGRALKGRSRSYGKRFFRGMYQGNPANQKTLANVNRQIGKMEPYLYKPETNSQAGEIYADALSKRNKYMDKLNAKAEAAYKDYMAKAVARQRYENLFPSQQGQMEMAPASPFSSRFSRFDMEGGMARRFQLSPMLEQLRRQRLGLI